jgi:hypothetical protein
MPDPSYLDLATMPDPRILGSTIIFDVRPRRDLTPYMAAIPKKIELSMFFRLQSIVFINFPDPSCLSLTCLSDA